MSVNDKNNKESKPVLCFFTSTYPYGRGEPFIENELDVISSRFSTIYLFHSRKDKEIRTLPENVQLIFIEPPAFETKFNYFIKNIFLFLRLSITELFCSRQKSLFLKKLRYNLTHIIITTYYADRIKLSLDEKIMQNAYFYSYWFSNWNFALSILKYKKFITYTVTRAHGFDVYEDNGQPNYQPYRNFCLTHTDKVLTVSKMATIYLHQIYPKYASKISCQYLGTKYYGLNPVPIAGSAIHLVSCSNIVTVKRVHLVIEVLKLCNVNIKWTHIGEGPLKENLIALSKTLPKNCEVLFLGSLKPTEIFDFYATTPIDLFINCSSSEGLPVSIMEAISFGIPVIATNVGGSGEIINPVTGYLIHEDVDFEMTAKLIEGIRNDNQLKRENITRFWENKFSANKNYSTFIDDIFFK